MNSKMDLAGEKGSRHLRSGSPGQWRFGREATLSQVDLSWFSKIGCPPRWCRHLESMNWIVINSRLFSWIYSWKETDLAMEISHSLLIDDVSSCKIGTVDMFRSARGKLKWNEGKRPCSAKCIKGVDASRFVHQMLRGEWVLVSTAGTLKTFTILANCMAGFDQLLNDSWWFAIENSEQQRLKQSNLRSTSHWALQHTWWPQLSTDSTYPIQNQARVIRYIQLLQDFPKWQSF